ncbi:hypothetical protein COO60DRAFT_1588821, partial [Scenedesmus sp. NREL 46B-D3]
FAMMLSGMDSASLLASGLSSCTSDKSHCSTTAVCCSCCSSACCCCWLRLPGAVLPASVLLLLLERTAACNGCCCCSSCCCWRLAVLNAASCAANRVRPSTWALSSAAASLGTLIIVSTSACRTSAKLLLLLPIMVSSAAAGCRCSQGGRNAAGTGSDATTPSSWCDAACSVSSTARRHAASRPLASSSSRMPLMYRPSGLSTSASGPPAAAA